jgi:hypothetical protein
MANETVNAWDRKTLIVSDASVATFGAVVDPAAAQAYECITVDLGPMEVGDVRPKKDRTLGRGMQSGFVEGRVKPIPFTVEASVKTRAAATTVPIEDALYRAGGLIRTVGGGNVVYSYDATPLATTNGFLGVSIYSCYGTAPYSYLGEQLRGGVAKTLDWSGGDKELMLKVSGEGIGKYHQGFGTLTVTNVATTFVFANVEEGYRFGLGLYQCESEIIRITAMNYTTFTATIARAQLASSAASHAAAWYPYRPAMSYTGTPISEGATVTTTVDGVAPGAEQQQVHPRAEGWKAGGAHRPQAGAHAGAGRAPRQVAQPKHLRGDHRPEHGRGGRNRHLLAAVLRGDAVQDAGRWRRDDRGRGLARAREREQRLLHPHPDLRSDGHPPLGAVRAEHRRQPQAPSRPAVLSGGRLRSDEGADEARAPHGRLHEHHPGQLSRDQLADGWAPFVRLGSVPLTLNGSPVASLRDYLGHVLQQPGRYNVVELARVLAQLNSVEGSRELFSERRSGGSTSTGDQGNGAAGSATGSR